MNIKSTKEFKCPYCKNEIGELVIDEKGRNNCKFCNGVLQVEIIGFCEDYPL